MKRLIEDIVTQLTELAGRNHPPTPLDWHDFRNDFMAIVHRLEFLTLEKNPKSELPILDENIPAVAVCGTCGSDDILFDAYAVWDEDIQCFTVQNIMDKGHFCNQCDGERSIEWKFGKDQEI